MSPGAVAERVGDLAVAVHGPGESRLTGADLARLLGPRAAGLGSSPCAHVVAEHGGRVVGVALFERVDRTVFVRDVGYDPAARRREAILAALVRTLELVCQAGGATRLVFPPGLRLLDRVLRRRGYHLVCAECAGCWFERPFD
jgi:hypothetical protein